MSAPKAAGARPRFVAPELEPPGGPRRPSEMAPVELARSVAYRSLGRAEVILRGNDGQSEKQAMALRALSMIGDAAARALESFKLWDLQRDYLDHVIRQWRRVRDGEDAPPESLLAWARELVDALDTGASAPTEQDVTRTAAKLAELYIDAGQATRDSLVGAALPEEDPQP